MMVINVRENRSKLGHGGRQAVMGSRKGETGIQGMPRCSVTRRGSSMVVVAWDLVLQVITLVATVLSLGLGQRGSPHHLQRGSGFEGVVML